MGIYKHNMPFRLESGKTIPELQIRYDTFGTLSPEADNVIWVCHALTANSDVSDWWPNTIEKGRFLDPEKYFIVCANILGSPYGTTSPVKGNCLGEDFPVVTVVDIVHAHRLLADYLGIKRIRLLIGASIGGFQCMEWAAQEPERFQACAFIATGPRATPWACAFNETQRMALTSDATWNQPGGGAAGLAAARAIAMLSYRGPEAYNLTQEEQTDKNDVGTVRRVHSYQQYQGEKLARRFDPVCYLRLTQAVDSHNIGRGRGSLNAALSSITPPVLVVGISTDLLFPVAEMPEWVKQLPNAKFEIIDSEFGHDGFLVEADLLNALILKFIKQTDNEKT